MRLEELTPGVAVGGLLTAGVATVVNVQWYGSDVAELTFKADGGVASQLLFRDDEARLELVRAGRPWSFDGDGALLRLASEARRIRLAYLFDPLLAVHTSEVEPLPHQIAAVYEVMLPRQPLRFLLADDPGAGKTIMAGLLIRELAIRGDLRRCLIVCPGNLVEQWQDELARRFHLDFAIVTREQFAAAAGGNPFQAHPLCLARLDHLARNEEAQARLWQIDWDLVVCDEAHKLAASVLGDEVRETRRYKLGKRLAEHCRHFLLLTATPHNGKEEDFQQFMALLDPDRFAGRPREGARPVDASDLMRRLVKERLLKFDGTPLFPERRAASVHYALSELEAELYAAVTAYVRQEMDRADRLALAGEERRRVTVGFALTTLQRRLASSPEAIYQSLRRRRERLERRRREEERARGAPARRGGAEQSPAAGADPTAAGRRGARRVPPAALPGNAPAAPQLRGEDGLRTIREEALPYLTDEDLADLDEAPESEVERLEEEIADRATAARSLQELRLEIESLQRLEALAQRVRQAGTDRKWEQLSDLLQGDPEMFDPRGRRRKLIIFTEHRDTLSYLQAKLSSLLGRPEAIAVIHGSLSREARRAAQERFTQDPEVQLLLATDAAGEGVNLQRANLMVNYDLPWNPNRLEQRFGRIHRIGQTEVCWLWNLVAPETREGDVFARLFAKLEREREALGGQVFDVLGTVFAERPLRELLLEAIRYGDRPERRDRLRRAVEGTLDHEHLRALLEERALARDSMDLRQVLAIKAAMERAEARRLQPHFIAAFFREAFTLLGGTLRRRERGRYEVTHVPALLRQGDRPLGASAPVQARYERITFDKALTALPGLPPAALVCPGHPLLDAVIDVVLERHRDLLRRGALLVDPANATAEPRLLVYLEHAIADGRPPRPPNSGGRTSPPLRPNAGGSDEWGGDEWGGGAWGGEAWGGDGAGAGGRHTCFPRLAFVELLADGSARAAGPAPYLDYRPLTAQEQERARAAGASPENWEAGSDAPAARNAASASPQDSSPQNRGPGASSPQHWGAGAGASSPQNWGAGASSPQHWGAGGAWASPGELEARAVAYAARELIPPHLREVREAREERIRRTVAAVKERLTREIAYWDRRAEDLAEQERAGKQPKMNAALARGRADELEARLQRRLQELEAERRLAALPPRVVGAALILPAALVGPPELGGRGGPTPPPSAEARREVERLAMDAVMAAERALGCAPRDVSAENRGYDIESAGPDGRLRFIEVKGRAAGADTVTITKNEILTALNTPDRYILALVPVEGGGAAAPSSDASGGAPRREIRGAHDRPAGARGGPPAPPNSGGPGSCALAADRSDASVGPEGGPLARADGAGFGPGTPRYLRRPFRQEPDFGVTSVNYDFAELLARAEAPT